MAEPIESNKQERTNNMNIIQSIHLDPDKMVIVSTLEDGRSLQSQRTRQTKGPAAESAEEFLQRMASLIQERVASTQDPSSGWVALRDEPTEPPREW